MSPSNICSVFDSEPNSLVLHRPKSSVLETNIFRYTCVWTFNLCFKTWIGISEFFIGVPSFAFQNFYWRFEFKCSFWSFHSRSTVELSFAFLNFYLRSKFFFAFWSCYSRFGAFIRGSENNSRFRAFIRCSELLFAVWRFVRASELFFAVQNF